MTNNNPPREGIELAKLDAWIDEILADPITKSPTTREHFPKTDGIIDARVYLKNTFGFNEWESGQSAFEVWESNGDGYDSDVNRYRSEIEYDRPIYERFQMAGRILDIGGLTGTVREFLQDESRYLSIDPFIQAITRVPPSKVEAYECLSRPLNFIGAMSEFLPFVESSFDWVHMRSMLDHVQVPDLSLKEAHRVLRKDGKVLIGMSIEGGRDGKRRIKEISRDLAKLLLSTVGLTQYKDHHTWHPTLKNLSKLITENGFFIEDVYWQPHWKDRVVYIQGKKK